MRLILRSVGAVLLGAIVAGVLIACLEFLGSKIFPLPPGTDPMDMEAVKAAMANVPVGALLLVLFGWFVGTAAGAWIAARVAGRAPMAHGLIVGALLLTGGIANMLMLPHPSWFWVLAVAVFAVAAYLGARLAAGGAGPKPSLAPV
jgi:uncharacterized protein YacL